MRMMLKRCLTRQKPQPASAGCGWMVLALLACLVSQPLLALPKTTDVWMTVNNDPVQWDEYYFWLTYSLRAYRQMQGISNNGDVSRPDGRSIDWQAQVDGEPLAQWLKHQAGRYACEQREVRRLASQRDIRLTEQDQTQMQQQRQTQIRTYGGEREYLTILRRMYVSEAVYDRLQETDRLSARLFDSLYGEEARNVEPALVDDYIQARQLRHVGYLFRQKPADANAAAALKQQLLDTRKTLLASQQPASALLALMREQGEDPQMKRYPQGRLISAGQLPPVLESAWQQLDNNGISPLLETAQGWYLLTRLPITATTRVNNNDHPLRYWAAYQQRFRPMVEQGCAALPVTVAAEYQTLDLATVLH